MHAIANPRVVVFKSSLNIAPSHPFSYSVEPTKPLNHDEFLMMELLGSRGISGSDRMAWVQVNQFPTTRVVRERTPLFPKPSWLATEFEMSSERPRMNGPRSRITTWALQPLRGLVTINRVPIGSVTIKSPLPLGPITGHVHG
jgi:hypothetical protein